jgi:hypothetical protein
MSDIFISYKREEQAIARNLANALEGEGWTVWWDPKLRAGERFNDVIEKALNDAKCVIVLWSKRSVESLYVKDEATHALKRNKLVPVTIQQVELPFRFEELHTPSLCDWDGSKDFSEYRKLIDDISEVLRGRPAATVAEEQRHMKAEESRKAEDESLREGRRSAIFKFGFIRILARSIGIFLFLALPAIWLLVRFDLLDANTLRLAPPLLVTGVLLIAVERFLLGR